MVNTAPIFSDHMVLQKGRNISVFGTGNDGERVTVKLGEDTAEATVRSGEWLAVLPAREEYAEGLKMTVTGEGFSRTFTDISIGEVWLAGGQSNMEYELQNCTTGAEHLAHDKPEVRFCYTPKIVKGEPDYEEKMRASHWSRFEGDAPKNWSAVGYIFAKELSERLGCTVGIIGCNWGGTKASHWMSAESLSKDADMRRDYDKYMANIAGKTDEQLTAEWRGYEAYNAAWEKRRDAYYANTPDPTWDGCLKECGECRYPGPLVPLNPMRPMSLYESMIKRVCPYTLAGFLYYQGESDDTDPEPYYKLLRGLIDLWRTDWGDDELPFLIVQLPMHLYKGDTDRKNWCIIREAQDKAYRTIRNTGLAVAIDCGEENEIHPHDKEQVGHRLCEQALCTAYGDKNEAYNAPMFRSVIIRGNTAEIAVKTASKLGRRCKYSGFELAGADGEYKPAECHIDGDKIYVRSPEVPEPRHVRYLWTNYTPDIPIYNASGLPLAPFRA